VVPAAIEPTAPPLFEAPPAGCVTTLPLAVVRGVFVVGRELELELERVGVRDGDELRDRDEVAGAFAGTSFNCG
jgi:hypothetical protein